MQRKSLILGLSLFAVLTCRGAVGQDAQPQITVVHPGVEALIADLLSLTGLTSLKEQEYGVELDFFIQDMSIGMDVARPIRVDALSGSGPVNYLFWVPYTEQDLFLDNLESISFPAFQQPGIPDLFLLDDEIDQGWLRFLPKSRYAVLAFSTPDTHKTLKQLVLAAGNPEPAFVPLQKLRASALLTLNNSEVGDESQTSRRQSFVALCTEDLAALQQRPSESTSGFDLRKGTWSIVYDELERIYVEAAAGSIWSSLDRQNSQLSVSFDATGIASTSLADSIAQFGQAEDAFAGVQPLVGNVLSGRLNVSVDSLRQKNAAQFLNLLTADAYNRIDGSKTFEEAQKQATRKIFDDVVTLFRDAFASGNVNGFVEATHDGTDFTMVGAVSVPGSDRLTETLKQVPLAHSGNMADLDFATAGDIKIHKVTLAAGFVELADQVFGAGREFFIGVGRDQVWLATGPGAVAVLESKVAEAGGKETSQMVLQVDAVLAPWIRRLHELAKERETPKVVAERAAWRENLLRLKQLSESLGGDDRLRLSVDSAGDQLLGAAHLSTGVLRFIGRQLARLGKELVDP